MGEIPEATQRDITRRTLGGIPPGKKKLQEEPLDEFQEKSFKRF